MTLIFDSTEARQCISRCTCGRLSARLTVRDYVLFDGKTAEPLPPGESDCTIENRFRPEDLGTRVEIDGKPYTVAMYGGSIRLHLHGDQYTLTEQVDGVFLPAITEGGD